MIERQHQAEPARRAMLPIGQMVLEDALRNHCRCQPSEIGLLKNRLREWRRLASVKCVVYRDQFSEKY